MPCTVEHLPVGDTQLYCLKGGSGPPALVLHGIEGNEGWLAFHEALAQSFTVYAPSHPGYGHTQAPSWVTSVWHQAVFYNWALQHLGDVNLVGVGLGGWIAASMAVMCQTQLRRLVLIGAAGLKPEKDEIFDVFVAPWTEVIRQSFADPDSAAEYQRIYGSAPVAEFGGIREAGRVMSMRMCFKPYMYDPSLLGMLGKIDVPTLIVWGDQDRIMPMECARMFSQAIPHAQLKMLDRCGHFAHLDRPEELAAMIREFAQ